MNRFHIVSVSSATLFLVILLLIPYSSRGQENTVPTAATQTDSVTKVSPSSVGTRNASVDPLVDARLNVRVTFKKTSIQVSDALAILSRSTKIRLTAEGDSV